MMGWGGGFTAPQAEGSCSKPIIVAGLTFVGLLSLTCALYRGL